MKTTTAKSKHILIMKRKFKQWWSRRVWRYQRGNQNPYIEEQSTIPSI